MPTHNGNPVFRGASGANAGRGDDAHGVTPGVTRVYNYSAATRNATPLTSDEMTAARERGESAPVANGSMSSTDVSNSGGLAEGEGMSMVRSKYREQRKAGMTPDRARSMALSPYSYPAATGPGGKQGPNFKWATDYEGNPVR